MRPRLELDFGLIPNVNHEIHFVMSFPWLVIDSMVLRNQLFLNLWLPLPSACSSFVWPCYCFWKFLSTMLGSQKKKKKIIVMQKVEVFKNMKLPSVLFLFWEFWLRRSMIGRFKPFSTIKAIATCRKTPHLKICHFVPFLLSPLGLY